MLKNNIEIDVKTKCTEKGVTQSKLADELEISAPYINRIIRNKENVLNNTFILMMEELGYDVRLVYEKREEEQSDNQ